MDNEFFITSVQQAIRAELRARHWTYRDLALAVGVAEVTIKRWMTADDLSLQRVASVAHALEVTPTELFKRADRGAERTFILDAETEQALVEDSEAHRVWEALRLGHSPQEVRTHYALADLDWVRVLSRLEALDLAEFHPEDRVRLLHEGIHNWMREGPLWMAYRELHAEWVRPPLLGEVPSVLQAAIRAVGPTFWDEAEGELLALAHRWRDRAWRDQVALPRSAQRRVRWVLMIAEAPDWPELPAAPPTSRTPSPSDPRLRTP